MSQIGMRFVRWAWSWPWNDGFTCCVLEVWNLSTNVKIWCNNEHKCLQQLHLMHSRMWISRILDMLARYGGIDYIHARDARWSQIRLCVLYSGLTLHAMDFSRSRRTTIKIKTNPPTNTPIGRGDVALELQPPPWSPQLPSKCLIIVAERSRSPLTWWAWGVNPEDYSRFHASTARIQDSYQIEMQIWKSCAPALIS